MTLPIINIEISASSVAWYGAILATGSLIVSILNSLKDRRKIKVKISNGFLIPDPWDGEAKKIFIEAQNHGKRPVNLSNVGFKLSDGSSIILPNPKNIKFPFNLSEGQSTSTFFEINDLKPHKEKIKYGFYTDSIGNVYKTKFNKNLLKNEK